MNRVQFVLAVALGAFLGLSLLSILMPLSRFSGESWVRNGNTLVAGLVGPIDRHADVAPIASSTPGSLTPTPLPVARPSDSVISTPSPGPVSPTSSAPPVTTLTVKNPAPKSEDAEHVLLLYDAVHTTEFDANLCKIAGYYGLRCKKFILGTQPVTDESLKESGGKYFRLIGVSAETLSRKPSLLTPAELSTIRAAVENGGSTLSVSKVADGQDVSALSFLTRGAVAGVTKPDSAAASWTVAPDAPQVTGVFTGQTIRDKSGGTTKRDFGLVFGPASPVSVLITTTTVARASYPIFVQSRIGAGAVFVDAGQRAESLDRVPFKQLYYGAGNFSKIVPLLFTVHFALGDAIWHAPRLYANLMIDDPPLVEPTGSLGYLALLQEMQLHNFHTTIAFIPANWDKADSIVPSLFRAWPDRFSIVQHGNNHNGYEFYKYQVSPGERFAGTLMTARPFGAQEANIVEGLQRMDKFTKLTGIPYGRIMIFPWEISPTPTLGLLKKYNFQATVNSLDVPLGATPPNMWDYGMYPANMAYSNFPALPRRFIDSTADIGNVFQDAVFDLYIGRPALFGSHAKRNDLFGTSTNAFDPMADRVSRITTKIQWQSLGYVLDHSYLERENDDKSLDVKIFGNHAVISNDSPEEKTVHVYKDEDFKIPISRLTVNGEQRAFNRVGDRLAVDLVAPAGSSLELVIEYAH